MELSYIIVLGVGIGIGFVAGYVYLAYSLRDLIKDEVIRQGLSDGYPELTGTNAQPKDPKDYFTCMTIERENGILYLYEGSQFMCQASDVADLAKQVLDFRHIKDALAVDPDDNVFLFSNGIATELKIDES